MGNKWLFRLQQVNGDWGVKTLTSILDLGWIPEIAELKTDTHR